MNFKLGCVLATVLALTAAWLTEEANAQGRAKIGTLQCNLAPTIGLIVTSRQRLSCTYTPDGPWPAETYFGHFTTIGLDIGVNRGGRMVWAVFAPINRHYRGALAGTYVGVSADAAVGVGLGANALVGGSHRSIALQPLSVEANTGVDLTAGVSSSAAALGKLDWRVVKSAAPNISVFDVAVQNRLRPCWGSVTLPKRGTDE